MSKDDTSPMHVTLKAGAIIFSLGDGSCEVNISPVGCYKENKENLAMQGIFHNEAAPDKPNFSGYMLQFSENYEEDFSEFLCRCARKAQINGWEYFGVRELGELKSHKNEKMNP